MNPFFLFLIYPSFLFAFYLSPKELEALQKTTHEIRLQLLQKDGPNVLNLPHLLTPLLQSEGRYLELQLRFHLLTQQIHQLHENVEVRLLSLTQSYQENIRKFSEIYHTLINLINSVLNVNLSLKGVFQAFKFICQSRTLMKESLQLVEAFNTVRQSIKSVFPKSKIFDVMLTELVSQEIMELINQIQKQVDDIQKDLRELLLFESHSDFF